jgi:hypothetical protein
MRSILARSDPFLWKRAVVDDDADSWDDGTKAAPGTISAHQIIFRREGVIVKELCLVCV